MKKHWFIKVLSLVFAVAITVSLSSCGGGPAGTQGSEPPQNPGGDPTVEGGQYAPKYGQLVENPWASTAETPTSTFSSDVDTASYARLRAFLNQGMTVKSITKYYGGSIRTEELLNYFSYTANAPTGTDLFGVRTELAPCPWNSEAHLLMMTFKAREVDSVSAGNNLVFLVDVSGSMAADNKLPLLKEAFSILIDTLTEKDTVSIVTYSGKEQVLLAGESGANKEKIRQAVQELTARGSTNGQAGMERAYSLAQDFYIEGGNNRIIMATDGDLNVGISTTDDILKFVQQKRQSGIFISTMGFGTSGYNDSNLETIADNGNGTYYFIDGMTEARKIFGEDLVTTLYTVAQDVKFQVTFNEKAISAYRLIGYESRVMEDDDFEDDAKDAGEVGSGQQLVVCYELKLTETAAGADELMTLSVRHKDPGAYDAIQRDYKITPESITDTPSEDLQFASAVIVVAMLLHESEYLDKDIKLDYVKETLYSINTDDFYKNEFKAIIK